MDAAGPWSIFADHARTIPLAEGFRRAVADPAALSITPGCLPEASLPGGIEAAVAAAEAAEVVVLVLGETALMSAEAQSRVTIDIPAPQQALAEAVVATGRMRDGVFVAENVLAKHDENYMPREVIDTLKAQGARVLGTGEPKIGAHGKPVLFLHPKDFNGCLIELEQV